MKKRRLALALFVILLGISPFAYSRFVQYRQERVLLEKRRVCFQALAEELHEQATSFSGEAGIVIKDLSRDWEIAIRQDLKVPSASLVKIPIMSACFYAAYQHKLDFEEKLSLGAKDITSGSGVLRHMAPGKEFTIEELLELMITESDNTATNMLIDKLGFSYLNETFDMFGLKDTNISRHMMDFKKRSRGIENYTSAKDIALLLQKIYRRQLIDSDYSCQGLELLKRQKNNSRIPAKLPADVTVAHKTGLEKTVCHDAGIIFTDQGDFLICVLTRHNGKGSNGAKEFISNIALLTYNCYQRF